LTRATQLKITATNLFQAAAMVWLKVWLKKDFKVGGFKYELQHGLTRRETPRGVS
jgi:hypothetical protein